METIALIERNKNGKYCIYTPNLQSTISGEGETVAEAKADFAAAYKEALESFAFIGRPVPEELEGLEFEYQYDLSAFYDAHPYLNVSKTAKYLGINDTLMRQYKRGQYISEKQIARIQSGLRSIGAELQKVTLIR